MYSRLKKKKNKNTVLCGGNVSNVIPNGLKCVGEACTKVHDKDQCTEHNAVRLCIKCSGSYLRGLVVKCQVKKENSIIKFF